jgi:mRNA-degrading endonuclease RelE of RelBE toxin-antitoxin system
MNLKIRYLKKSKKFFDKNSHILNEEKADELLLQAAKKIFLQDDNTVDLKQLKGKLKNYYRIRLNKIRILFEIENNELQVILIVDDIDFRGDVYK